MLVVETRPRILDAPALPLGIAIAAQGFARTFVVVAFVSIHPCPAAFALFRRAVVAVVFPIDLVGVILKHDGIAVVALDEMLVGFDLDYLPDLLRHTLEPLAEAVAEVGGGCGRDAKQGGDIAQVVSYVAFREGERHLFPFVDSLAAGSPARRGDEFLQVVPVPVPFESAEDSLVIDLAGDRAVLPHRLCDPVLVVEDDNDVCVREVGVPILGDLSVHLHPDSLEVAVVVQFTDDLDEGVCGSTERAEEPLCCE